MNLIRVFVSRWRFGGDKLYLLWMLILFTPKSLRPFWGSTFGLAKEMKKLAEEFLEWRQSLC